MKKIIFSIFLTLFFVQAVAGTRKRGSTLPAEKTFDGNDLFIQYKLRLETGRTGTGSVVTLVEMSK